MNQDLERFEEAYDFFVDNIDSVTTSYERAKEYMLEMYQNVNDVTDPLAKSHFLLLIGLAGLNFMVDNSEDFASIGYVKINEILGYGRYSIKEALNIMPSDELSVLDILYTALNIEDNQDLVSATLFSCPNPYKISTDITSPDFLAMYIDFVAIICDVKNWVKVER